MNYQETVDYLFEKLPMFTRIGAAAYKKDLTNTIRLCEALGNPHKKFKSIHVAGTNGKGSTSHMLASIMQTAGYKTGLYTSPHLYDFRERIKVDGVLCTEDFVVDFTKKILPLIDEIQPSFFEITVAMAFAYFSEQEVDIAIVEVGLGGRLDSTNIITPELCIITNIGWDHMNMLGNTLPEIASEKAGIIKKNIPVIIGELHQETKPVFLEKAAIENAPIYFAQENLFVSNHHLHQQLLEIEISNVHNHQIKNYHLDLTGSYQTKNILSVILAVELLNKMGLNLPDTIVMNALQQTKKNTQLHGRWEKINERPTIILDVGHNVDGIQEIVHQLSTIAYRQLHIVIGMAKDKEVDKVLSLLPIHATYYFTKAQIPRALDELDLQEKANFIGLKGSCFSSVMEALAAAKLNSHSDDLILVCGSVFVVAEVEISELQ
ncbi:MAG: bifunctional folylpolyglutamate synthase/dihydrofolate synthase [Chitinophagaceae bacterium]